MFMFHHLINNNPINIIPDHTHVYEVLNWSFFHEREKLMFVCFCFFLYLFKNLVDMNNPLIFVKLYD